jgi:hypothetical protein
MVTLVFSYYVVAYLLIPAALFRWFVALFIQLKNFQRTKTQEITFAVGASLLPFFLAWAVAWTSFIPHAMPIQQSWGDRRSDYKMVYAGIVDEKDALPQAFWKAVTRCGRRQADFLIFFYYPFVLIEAGFFALLVTRYGEWKGNPYYRLIARKLLLPHLSEWEMLLTPFNFPKNVSYEVWLDVLTSDNVLIRGLLGDRFLDSNGVLTGIVLAHRPDDATLGGQTGEHSPKRFDREMYRRAAEVYPYSTKAKDYWRDIPSGAFYVPSEKILNMNITYVATDPSTTAKEAMKELTEFEIEPLEGGETTDSFEDDSYPD